jgi:hypothetical protein
VAHLPGESPATLVSIDFFAVPTLTGRILLVFIVLLYHR